MLTEKVKEQILKKRELLEALRPLWGILHVLKKILWVSVSFFIAYLALMGYIALEKPSVIGEVITNSNVSENLFVFLAVGIKTIFTELWTEWTKTILILFVSSMMSFIEGYSLKNFLMIVVIYIIVVALEWICGKMILIINERSKM